MTTTRIDIDNGKYSILHENSANLRALRYGEPWPAFEGSNLILAMAQEIEDLREKLAQKESHSRACKLYTLDGVKHAVASAPFQDEYGRELVAVKTLDESATIRVQASFAKDRFNNVEVPTFYAC